MIAILYAYYKKKITIRYILLSYHVNNHFSQSLPLFFVDVLEYVTPVVM